jgi:alpha-beta hydrolase superfamily lysophospholipase
VSPTSELPFERAFREWVEREGMGWRRISYPRSEAGGDTVAYRLSPASPRGVVLIVHGAGNDGLFGMVELARRLLLSGLEVVTFHLDGHGRGGATRLTADAARSAVPAAVEVAGAARRGLPLYTVGISLGGSLLLHALPHLSPPPAAAALVCAPLHVHLSRRAIAAELRPRLLHTLWRGRADYGATGLIPSFGRWKRDVYPLRLDDPGATGAFGYVESLNRILDSLQLEDAARTTRLPVSLIYGASDRLVPPAQGERLATLLPHADLLLLPGESHLTTPLAPRAVGAVVEWFA